MAGKATKKRARKAAAGYRKRTAGIPAARTAGANRAKGWWRFV